MILVAIWLTLSSSALAWGNTGHVLVSRAGATAFPMTLPDFIRSSSAVDEIAELGPEPDRSKGAGQSHDRDRDPGHGINVDDDGIVAGVVAISALPSSREAYDSALRSAGTDQYQMGFLPYVIIDGWQQIAKDFAVWRVDRAGERSATNSADRAYFTRDRSLREMLTLHDIGIWSHYVADGSQPLHVSVHHNGWGDYPNPKNYTESTETHAMFEGAFVRTHVSLDAVRSAMRPVETSSAPITMIVGDYLLSTEREVVPFYDLERAGEFRSASPAAIAFTVSCLASGASEMRDLVVDAYSASTTIKVGYPHGVTPHEAESGNPPTETEVAPGD